MAFIDYYKILGVSKDIPQKDVRAAYRKRAKQFHPDLHPNDPKAKAKFQALNEAYDVLSDPDKRAKYDKYGEQWKAADAFEQNGGSSGGFGGFSNNPFEGFDFSGFSGGGGFSSFFQDLFGGGARTHSQGRSYGFNSKRQNNGEMNAKVKIDLYTAMLGGDVIIQLSSGKKIRLKVKPGTQNDTKVRVRGKGYDRGDGTFGDLIITYHVKLPENLNDRQRELLMQMRNAG